MAPAAENVEADLAVWMTSRRQRLKQIAACAALPLLAPPPNNQRNDDNLFHWEHLRPAVAEDVEVAKSALPSNRK